MYTEEEAKKKWCPINGIMVALVVQVQSALLKIKDADMCQTSECMMWRWEDGTEYAYEDGSESGPERGYCGLAGGIHAR